MEGGDEVDLVRQVGMPDRFTPYTHYLTFILSCTWALAAIPALVPAFVAPPASGGYDHDMNVSRNFYTVIQEFGLDMEEADTTTTMYFIGSLVIGQIPCALSDRVGRLPILFWSALLTGLSGVMCAFAPNYTVFLIGRFLQGAFFTATTNVNWVLCCESVPLSCHGKASIMFGVMWVIGYCIIAPLAYLFPTWRTLFLVTSVPTVIYAFVAKATVRESLSFLIVQRRKSEAEAWIQHMERFGSCKFENNMLDNLLRDEDAASERNVTFERSSQHTSVWRMCKAALRHQKISLYLAICIYMWITDFLVYNGLSMTSTGIKVGNPSWNYVLSGFVELPAAFVLPYMMDRIGRRPTVILSHAVTAISLSAMCFISIEMQFVYMMVWLVAKFGTASSFIALYIYGSEIFPIKYRNICLGICSTLGNVGAILAPRTAQLGVSNAWVVFTIYAAVSAVSAFLDLMLPETIHLKRSTHSDKRPVTEDCE